ncbi:MAG TPA: dihydropteroate synthase [Alphaproteobacteria bacterium]|nr:dihydropteroate synthase [Alphaproteobacteria bacterium]
MTPALLEEFCPRAGDADARVHLRPDGIGGRVGLPLAGGPLRFERVEIVVRRGDAVERMPAPLDLLENWAGERGIAGAVRDRLAALTAPRPALGGFALDRPLVMGIVNVTPDSFSDGGDFADPAAAIRHGEKLLADGADILDIGGESTRPGAAPPSAAEEAVRVVPVVKALAAAGAVVSIDTRHAAVMRAALDAGAAIINDVSALAGDPESMGVAAASGAPVVLMHMLGEPQTMQADPRYVDAPTEIYDYLADRLAACVAAGIARDRIVVDPGIGFGKTVEHNLQILRSTALFHGLGCPVLIGVSRKRFIGALSRGEPPKERVAGSIAAGLAALDQGAQILRVHDVAETVQAVAMWRALRAG